MRAYVLVGNSRRLPKKHLIEIIPRKRLIDLVVENLHSIGFEVVVYAKYRIEVGTKVVIDYSSWILPSIVSILQTNSEVFIFGGDMPLIRKKAVIMMLNQREGDKTVIPKWKNGYLEPLHGFYTKASLPCFIKEIKRNKGSLTNALKNCPSVKFISAELMPPDTFFNVNYPKDIEKLREILKGE